MGNVQNEDLAATFDHDGVVCVRDLISPKWVDRLRDALEIALAHTKEGSDRAAASGKSGSFVAESALWQRYPVLRDFAFESPLAEIAGAILRSDTVRFFNDSIFVKEPGTDVPSPWHQDLPYLRISGAQTCSAWVALDDVTTDTGAVQYVAGSHKWNQLFVPIEFGTEVERGHRSDDGFEPMPDIDGDPDRYPLISFDLKPGDAVFHNLRTVHGAGGNSSSTRRRRAFSVRMCGDDVVGFDRLVGASRADATLVHGEPLNDTDFPVLWRQVAAPV